ncbi:MAG TPA: hypothetical protein P5060_02925 [Candidatus Absconditabacterales bacterium]|nr:hypothetical protein [Candidatus Absconditabacterales bacterium]
MPNIKFFGHKCKSDGYPSMTQHDINEKIIKMFEKTVYADDIVITMVESTVKDLKGNSRPYIQLEFTPEDYKHLDKIVEKLGTLKMDIQLLRIDEFIEVSKI